MNIVINAILYHKKPRGVGNYINTLLEEILKIDSKNNYYVLYGKWMEEYSFLKLSAPNLFLIECSIPRGKMLRNLYLIFRFPFMIKKFKPDVLHNIDSTPILFKTCKIISTIHDIAEFLQKEKYGKIQGFSRRLYVKKQTKKSDKIITVSNYSKQTICRTLKISEDKVHVIYNSYEKKDIAEFKADMGNKYILLVGEIERSKNFGIVIEAFNKIKDDNIELRIIGRQGNDYERIIDLYNSSTKKGKITIYGYVSDEDLMKLYANAYVLVFPSLFEGFGIPLIEAMGYGLPIISSNATCLPEIAGDAALYFNPNDVEDLISKINLFHSDSDLRRKLISNGEEQLKKFNKIDSAKETIKQYETV